jgi:Asp-tRNA(Asn)/Glu-tRNA(Gln) amidotransferase A subunit family amidase
MSQKDPSQSRRAFLKYSSLSLAATAIGCHNPPPAGEQAPSAPPAPGSPTPVASSATGVGPEVSGVTFTEAKKLVQIPLTNAEEKEAAVNWREAMAPLYERRTGPRKVELEPTLAPSTLWNPVLPGAPAPPRFDRFIPAPAAAQPLPKDDVDIAYASVTQLSRWIRTRQLTSERLTTLYLDRLQHFDPTLHCIITLTKDHALEQARAADHDLAAGRYRGPLHGIPWGAKDLLDTANIPTTYGAEPFRNRVPSADATVVQRLNAAGAVLVAKLSLGALANNDIWFGGQTMNPWLLEEGSSGSSAGPAAATAAGLVGFAIGSETEGSIVSPSMRCGVTGLRPTFGRVPRTGAMTLCWSLDKLGPMARSVEDTLLVLRAISGPDQDGKGGGDLYSVPSHLDYNAALPVKSIRVGYIPTWLAEPPATDVDRAALDQVKSLGMETIPVSIPNWPYDSLNILLLAEAAAAFEELTLSHQVDQLRMQTPDAWPNTFRQARFLSAVDLVQASRLRRKVAQHMAEVFTKVDVLLVPSLRDEMLTLTNFTGHPSLTLRAGFIEVTQARSDWAPDPHHPLPKFNPPRRVPYGITLIGRLFEEGTLGRVGVALERAFNVSTERPNGFS